MTRLLFLIFIGITFVSCGTAPDVKEKMALKSTVFFNNLEDTDSLLAAEPVSWENTITVTSEKAHSGNQSSRMDMENEFSVVFVQKLGYISQPLPKTIDFTAWIYAEESEPSGHIVANIRKADYYKSFPIAEYFSVGNEWKKVSASFILPDSLKPADEIKIYLWNNRKSRLWIDDIRLEFNPKE